MSENIISLTQNEKNVLEYIEQYMEQYGISPTYQEIKQQFGFASFNSVQRYLKQLQAKGYIGLGGGNQKRAITLLQSASALKSSLALVLSQKQQTRAVSTPKAPVMDGPSRELLILPLLGRVAAGKPIEALHHEEFTEVPPSMVKIPERTFTLEVRGNSMIDDGIFNGDILIVQEQKIARNGDISVCIVENEATVKRFYLHQSNQRLALPQVELRPANTALESMWYAPGDVQVRGIVVGLLRKF